MSYRYQVCLLNLIVRKKAVRALPQHTASGLLPYLSWMATTAGMSPWPAAARPHSKVTAQLSCQHSTTTQYTDVCPLHTGATNITTHINAHISLCLSTQPIPCQEKQLLDYVITLCTASQQCACVLVRAMPESMHA